MIVSTGMNDIRNITKAVNILEKYGVEYALMHTTNLYPTDPALVRLGAMQELMREFPDVPVGLSDHTLNNNACIAAMHGAFLHGAFVPPFALVHGPFYRLYGTYRSGYCMFDG